MRTIIFTIALFCSSLVSANSSAGEASQTILPIRFISIIGGDDLFNELKKIKRFEKTSEKLPGSPIALLVTLQDRMTAGGSAATLGSAFWAGSTLGILPVVSNKDLIVRYELMVNKNRIADISFTENFTEVKNLFSGHSTELEPEVLAWVLSTVPKFSEALENNEKVKALEEEYSFYFEE